MREVRLTGRLICQSSEECALVARLLPEHISLTRAERGCLLFEVTQSSDPLIWHVEERFSDKRAFRQHQKRAATSDWGRMTAEITRDYTVSSPGE